MRPVSRGSYATGYECCRVNDLPKSCLNTKIIDREMDIALRTKTRISKQDLGLSKNKQDALPLHLKKIGKISRRL